MKQEATLRMIYEWLLAGKKIKNTVWSGKEYIFMQGENLVSNSGIETQCMFSTPSDWSIYQEPEEKKKWFKVIVWHVDNNRPDMEYDLYESKEDFLNVNGYREEEFHWIKLEVFDYE